MKQARRKKLAACWAAIPTSLSSVTRDDVKIQHFGDRNVQNATVREARFLGLKTRLAFYWRAVRQKELLHLAFGRQHNCRHLKSTGSIAAYLRSENMITGYGS